MYQVDKWVTFGDLLHISMNLTWSHDLLSWPHAEVDRFLFQRGRNPIEEMAQQAPATEQQRCQRWCKLSKWCWKVQELYWFKVEVLLTSFLIKRNKWVAIPTFWWGLSAESCPLQCLYKWLIYPPRFTARFKLASKRDKSSLRKWTNTLPLLIDLARQVVKWVHAQRGLVVAELK